MPKRSTPLFRPKGLVVRGSHNDLSGGYSKGNTYHLYDEEGTLYYGKRGSADFPYAAVNEFLFARLARAVGFRVPNHGLQEIEGDHFFLSEASPHRPALEHMPDYLHCPVWREEFAGALVLDVWLMNHDRHQTNFLLEKVEPEGDGTGPVYRLHLIDHDRALFAHGLVLAALYQRDRWEPRQFLHSSITAGLFRKGLTLQRSHLEQQIPRVRAVSREDLAGFISDIPNVILPPEEKSAVEAVIADRAARLDALVSALCDHVAVRSSFV